MEAKSMEIKRKKQAKKEKKRLSQSHHILHKRRSGNYSIRPPENSKITVTLKQKQSNLTVTLEQIPGIYTVTLEQFYYICSEYQQYIL